MSEICRYVPESAFCTTEQNSKSLTWVEQQQQQYSTQNQNTKSGFTWEVVNTGVGTVLDGWAKILSAKNQPDNNYYINPGAQNGGKNNTGLYIVLAVVVLIVLYFLVIKK